MSPDQIAALCEQFCQETATGKYSAQSQSYRLLENGTDFPSLKYDELMAAIIGLSKVLLRPGLNAVIDFDHYALWAWCGELLLGPMAQIKIHNQNTMPHEINELYQATIRAALAHCERPSKPQPREARDYSEFMNPTAATYLKNASSMILAYLTFPLLEALLKQVCREYVAQDAKVIKEFSRLSKKGQPYNSKIGDEAGISILLNLLYDHVANPDLKALLDRYRNHLQTTGDAVDAFELIYHWRCSSLHGTTNFPTIGGVILNLCLLISIYQIKDSFEDCVREGNMAWPRSINGGPSIDNFYPPRCFLPPL